MKLLREIFLGKWWHWLLLIALTALLWQAGKAKMHVIYFNWFLMGLLVLTIIGLLAMIYGTPKGEQITRDKLLDSDDKATLDRE